MNRRKRGGQFRDASVPDELADLQEGAVLYDRHRRECYQVASIGETSVGLHRDGTDFSVPRSFLLTWYRRRLFPIEESRRIDAPEWCSRRQGLSRNEETSAQTLIR
jgi:hypothetical protein